MATSKKRKDKLIRWADEIIRTSSEIYDSKNHEIKSESYNGQTAAFSVLIALSGLKPAMALYYTENEGNDDKGKKTNCESDKSEVIKNNIIELIASMYNKDKGDNINASSLYQKVITENNNDEKKRLSQLITEYAIALKLVIRTFKFKQS